MKKIYKLISVCLIFISIPTVSFSQILKEDFSGSFLRDWYIGNTSSPLPAEQNSWTYGEYKPYAGAEYGQSNLTSYLFRRFEYATVGYSEFDYDGATISKWLVTPMLYNIKNGDIIKFRTRAKPQASGLENTFNLLNQDFEALAECNRPNRMEIRLNTHYTSDGISADSVNFGNSPNDVGHFDNLIYTINASLTLEGYSTEWKEYSITISGLPINEVFNGRIGFRYFLTNGGYNNCQARYDLPEEADALIQLATNLPGKFGKAVEFGKIIFDIINTTQFPQVGKNGTYIGLDDIEISSSGISIIDNTSIFGEKRYFWNSGNISEGKVIEMGYEGKPGCSSSTFKYPERRDFYIENSSTETIKVFPKVSAFYGTSHLPLYLDYDTTKTTLNPGESLYITAKLKSIAPYFGIYYNRFWVENANGENLGEVRMKIHTSPPAPPKAICSKYSASAIINNLGEALVFDAKKLDDGSYNSCGTTADLKYEMLKSNDDPFTNITCDDLGLQDVQLKVTDTLTKRSSYCDAKLKVNIGIVPVMENNITQEYILPYYQGTMPTNLINKPAVIAGCTNVTPRLVTISDAFNQSLGIPLSLGVGTYELFWSTTDNAGNSGYANSTLKIIDTLSPVAKCLQSVDIGYTYELYKGSGYFIKQAITGKDDINARGLFYPSFDNTRVGDNMKIKNYQLSTTWKGYTTFSDQIPFTCADAGAEFPVTMKVIDFSGNSSTCSSYVKIKQPDQATCKNISVDLNPTNGVKNIVADDLLLNGGDGICGIKNSSVSKSEFTCADVNKTISVDVTYQDAANATHSCSATVKVNQYSKDDACLDTIKAEVYNSQLYQFINFSPVVSSVCSSQLSWDIQSNGATNLNESRTGTKAIEFNPGISSVSRTTIYLGDTFTCKQYVYVLDTVKPLISSTPTNQSTQLPSLGGSCTYSHEIVNPFQLGSYSDWSFTLSGASKESKSFNYRSTYFDENDNIYNYYDNQIVELSPGITTITLIATDLAGNQKVLTYTYDLFVQNQIAPYVTSDEFNSNPNKTLKGNFCGEYYPYKIASPVKPVCDQTGYMWYYEVRDSYEGNILFSRDSIAQDSGAYIPIKVGPKFNQSYSNVVYLGYHDKSNGLKTFSTYQYVSVIDTVIDKINCPGNVRIESNNNTTYTYDYTINSPIAHLCTGSFWGYSVTGATNLATTNQSAAYNSNQTITLGQYNLSDAYPSLLNNVNSIVQLNAGKNVIQYRILEESGNISLSEGEECTYVVEVIDRAVPVMICPPNDTVHRTSTSSCDVTVGTPCQQITGFTGPYGISGIGKQGGNSQITLDKSNMPNSIIFENKRTTANYSDAYITIIANCDGIVSFDWEYQSGYPQFFNPFISYNNYNPKAYKQAQISGFSTSNSGVQSGSYSQAVSKGQYLIIGVTEGGIVDGYFKINNFKAPYSDPTIEVAQPSFTPNSALFLASDLETSYSIGDHEINYTLYNTNNGSSKTCTQNVTIVDDFAATLVCNNTSLYLNRAGFAVLDPKEVVSTCFPLSSTTISKDTFNYLDLGTQNVSITSISQAGATNTCNFSVTVTDTIKPISIAGKFSVFLDNGNNGSIPDSSLRKLFYDNVGIETISASKTTFTCADVGTGTVTITATDSSGNSKSQSVLVDVYPLGFKFDDPNETLEYCIGESAPGICSKSVSLQNSLTHEWEYRINTDTVKNFNFVNYFLPENSSNHKFFRLKINQYYDYNYVAYTLKTDPSTIYFKVYDEENKRWLPVLKPLPRPSVYDGEFYLDVSDIDNVPYVAYLGYGGDLRVFRYVQNNWVSVNEGIFYTTNLDFRQLFANDGYVFPVVYNGKVRVAKEYYTELSGYNDYLYNNGSITSNTFVTNAKNIVAVRNSTNQNHFFRLNINPNSLAGGGAILPKDFGGKDSLLVDPTDNSSLFKMKSFKNEAYIAYKSLNGKLSVKKFDGTSNWTVVGNLDFSDNEIFQVNLGVVKDSLYVVYIETSDKLVVKKWNGTSWTTIGTGTVSSSNPISIVDIKDKLYIYSNGTMLFNDGWKKSNLGGACFSPPTDAESDIEYRVIASKINCASIYSGVKRVIVHEFPDIVVSDTALTGFGTANLEVTTTSPDVSWLNNENQYMSSGYKFTTPFLVNDTTYKVFASNGKCHSDTLNAYVYINSDTLKDIDISYRDSVCKGEFVEFFAESAENANYRYTLFEKNNETGKYSIADGSYFSPQFYFEPQKTATYRIKVQEFNYNAARLNKYGDYIDFGENTLPVTNAFTVEAWVKASSTNPSEVFGIVAASKSGESFVSSRWSWGASLNVRYEDFSSEFLFFPTLPVDYVNEWVHVATTVGPQGMSIYYNGELVATRSLSKTQNIYQGASNLILGLYGDYGSPPYTVSQKMTGVDEFRLWNLERTGAQIKANFNNCDLQNQSGLLVHNKFDTYDYGTETFTSLVGPNAIKINPNNTFSTGFRASECYEKNIDEKFFEPFQITVLENQKTIVDFSNNYSAEKSSCGGDTVVLFAKADEGTVFWYDALIDGNLIYTGDTLKTFFDKDSLVYAQAESVCERKEMYVNVNAIPKVLYTVGDIICRGDEIVDANYSVKTARDASGWKLFDLPTGGNVLSTNTPLYKTDTLYVEAFYSYYNTASGQIEEVCVAPSRTPLIIGVIETKITSISNDTSFCQEGSALLSAKGENGVIEWYDLFDVVPYTNFLVRDSVYQTPNITKKTKYLVRLNYLDRCYDSKTITVNVNEPEDFYETATVCGPYTWRDGKVYSYSDTNIVFVKQSAAACDSTFHLNLIVNNNDISLNKSNICEGDSAVVTVIDAKKGVTYTLLDASDSSGIDISKMGNDSSITFNTGALFNNSNFKLAIQKYGNSAVELSESLDLVRFNPVFSQYAKAITIESMVYFNGTGMPWAGQGTAGIDNQSVNVWLWHGGTFYVNDGIGSGSWRAANMPNVTTTGWKHVATVADETGLYVYYDGLLVSSSTSGITTQILNNSNSSIDLGSDVRFANVASRNSGVVFDNFAIWNVSRTAQQITQDKDNCLNGNETNLVFYSNFNSIEGSKFNNNLGGDGTMVNSDQTFSTTGFGNCNTLVNSCAINAKSVNILPIPLISITVENGEDIIQIDNLNNFGNLSNLNDSIHFSWYDCNDPDSTILATTTRYTRTEVSSYQVIANANTCYKESDCIDYLVTSAEQNSSEFSSLIYPNPSSGEFQIELNQDVDYTLTNMLGEKIRSGSFISGLQTLDVSAHPEGVYVLSFNGVSFKLIVRK